jgi:chitinase
MHGLFQHESNNPLPSFRRAGMRAVVLVAVLFGSVLFGHCAPAAAAGPVRDRTGAVIMDITEDGWILSSPITRDVDPAPAGDKTIHILSAAPDLFAPYTATATGSWPEVVAIGDLNGDGRNDVALATSYYADPDNDYMLFVFLQDESGGLLPPVKYPISTGRVTGMTIGDVDHDGRADVVLGHDRISIEIFTQNDSGGLNTSILYPTAFSTRVKIADMNHDGLQDVVGIGWGGSDVGVFLQNSFGTLDAPVTSAAPHGGYDDLELGDVNHDGLTDIVVMSGQGAADNLAILTQQSDGTMNSAVFYNVGGFVLTHGVTIGDFNGDSRNDVAVTYGGNSPNSFIAVFYQNGSGTLDPPVSYASYDIPEPIQAADINQDGRDDLVVLHGGWDTMGVSLQQKDGQLAAEQFYVIPYASHYNPQGLAVGDFTDDDVPDVAIADYNNGLVTLHNTTAPNAPPVAEAGDDQMVDRGERVTLDGSGSTDADGEIVRYSWRQRSGTRVNLRATDNPAEVTFSAPHTGGRHEQSLLLFELTVTDDNGASSNDTVQVLIDASTHRQ